MPHSITGKQRTKRPDYRPNAKRRKKEKDAAYDAAEAKDVISTKIPKKDRKERPVTGQLRRNDDTPESKRVRYLQKLLRQIETLKDRKEAGEKLNDAQLLKLGRMDEVVSEIEELLNVDLGSSSDEEEDGEDGDGISKEGCDDEGGEEQIPMKKR